MMKATLYKIVDSVAWSYVLLYFGIWFGLVVWASLLSR